MVQAVFRVGDTIYYIILNNGGTNVTSATLQAPCG